MKVNIEAISDALDSILAAETTFSSENAHTASIHSQPLPLSQSSVNPSQRKCSKPRPPEASGASLSSGESGAAADAAFVIESSVGAKKTTQQLQVSPSDGHEKALFARKAERKGRSPKITTSHDQENSPQLSGTVKNTDTPAADFFECIKSVELVAFKVVEATGVGIISALLTPQSVGRWFSSSQLPSKSWVTSTSLSPEACAVFELENRLDMRRRRELPSDTPSSRSSPSVGGSTGTYVQDFVAVLLVEDVAERQLLHLHSSAFLNRERDLFSVVIETSSSRRGGFVTAASTSAAPSSVTTLKIPGTRLNAFVRITISPPASEPSTKLIRVRAVCFFRSDSWSTQKAAPVQRGRSSLKGEVKATSQESAKAAPQDAQSVREQPQERGVTEAGKTQAPSLSLTKHEQERKGEGIAHFALSDRNMDADVAGFVKAVALARSRQDNATPKQPSLRGGCNVEYDWLLDTLVDVSTTKDNTCRKASLPDAGDEAPVLEYIRTLQAWNSAPALSVNAAVTYCLSETTSFSASTIFATGLFSHEAQNHLSQPFKLHFFVVSPSDVDQSSEQAYSSCACLPPVHFLAAIANQAALLGCTTELLFTCPESSGFGCALRTHNCTSGTQDAHYKLIFVVPVQRSRDMNEGGTTSVMKYLLRTALGIFRGLSDRRGISLSQECPFSSYSTLQCAKPCGALRLLIDGTRCFDDLIPVLAEWAEVSGSLRYYGSAAQRTLQLLFFPSWLASSDGESGRFGVLSEPRHEAQWSGLDLRLSGLWRKCTNGVDSVADDTVALEAEYHCPATYVWQSRRGALRLVLTNAHFMESFARMDGLVAPSPLVSLAMSYCRKEVGGATHTLPLTTLSESPWMSLLQAAERLRESTTASVVTSRNDAAADFFALRRRVTVSFAFHILSTAFKREWARVSASIPLCNGHIRDATLELPNVHVSCVGERVNGGNGMSSAVGLLDEDAFIDTLLQWQYPFPNVVVLHCTDVLSVAGPSPSLTSTTALCRPSSRVQEGVLSLFSEEVLHSFASVSGVDEALS
ncbi:conserved hypothetical protein [Leishmania major strain Friedlin]|uniref:Uncharacterized protein n=1 Tax=Leishmania major TaxID=5664 RepID=Q4Q560_LEIMA|nr:conserved hypothetical protein [Leishmania major strain Friedlin]CAG9580349.1 hypothetical_protein_-_conserved [Leishmania major strain Friedlin]CAJ08742.1 conserved hypothetical protein [Leishmania major strain Friedlin]|eukprot:XP_001685538.1 conserved hypothetical protein [Leishmania major strain Friedlin]